MSYIQWIRKTCFPPYLHTYLLTNSNVPLR